MNFSFQYEQIYCDFNTFSAQVPAMLGFMTYIEQDERFYTKLNNI